jgi:hypothetical protein
MLRCCSGSSRNGVRLPSEIVVQLGRNSDFGHRCQLLVMILPLSITRPTAPLESPLLEKRGGGCPCEVHLPHASPACVDGSVARSGQHFFWRFEPRQPFWRRTLKIIVTLAVTAVVTRYFGTIGLIVWFAIVILPIVYIHGIWLPRHGVNGWTAEPRDKYHALRGWPPPDARRDR